MPPSPSPLPSFPEALRSYARRSPWASLLFLLPAWLLFVLAPPCLLALLPRFAPDASSPALAAAARWLSFLAFLLWIPLYLRLARRPLPAPRNLLPTPSDLPPVAVSLLLYLAFSVPWNLLLSALDVPIPARTSLPYLQTALDASPPVAVLLLAYPLLAAPVIEELFFRGALLGWMAQILPAAAPPGVLRAGAAIALLVPALLFAFLHALPTQIPPFLLLALLLSRLAVRRGLPSAVLLHALCNLLALSALLLSPR